MTFFLEFYLKVLLLLFLVAVYVLDTVGMKLIKVLLLSLGFEVLKILTAQIMLSATMFPNIHTAARGPSHLGGQCDIMAFQRRQLSKILGR